MIRKNAFYAQSGGVTAVINASACGLIETARRHRDKIGKVYAGRHGIIGALTEDMIDVSKESHADHQRPALHAGRCLRIGALQVGRNRQESRAIRTLDRHIPRARHRLLLLQRRQRLDGYGAESVRNRGADGLPDQSASAFPRPSTTIYPSPTAVRVLARRPSTSPCPRARPHSMSLRWRAHRPRYSCSK